MKTTKTAPTDTLSRSECASLQRLHLRRCLDKMSDATGQGGFTLAELSRVSGMPIPTIKAAIPSQCQGDAVATA